MLEKPKSSSEKYMFNNYKSKYAAFREEIALFDWDFILFEQCNTNKQFKKREIFLSTWS